MNLFQLEILAADRTFFRGGCASLVIPTVDGLYGVMAGHEDEIVAVSKGSANFDCGDGKRIKAVLSAGICMIEGGKVTVLVESAELPEEIEKRSAERAAEEAFEEKRGRENLSDVKRAKAKMARTASRLSAKERSEID